MVDYVNYFSADPQFIEMAHMIIRRRNPQKTEIAEARAIFEWLKRHTRFVQDPFDREVLSTPRRAVEQIIATGRNGKLGIFMGDCDDLATLLATLVASIGVETRFAFGGSREAGIHHVWVQTYDEKDEKWVDMDLGVRRPLPFGKHHPFEIYEAREIF